jgi:uncharacterized protein
MPGPDTQVIDNPARGRFELALGGGAIAYLEYAWRQRAGSRRPVRALTHAEVPVERRGAGIGARLTAGVLELLRSRGEQALPLCPYVVDFIRRHPEYLDVVAP